MTYYHVTPKWDGKALLSLGQQISSGKVKMWEAVRTSAMRFDWPTPCHFDDMQQKDWEEMTASRDWQQYLDEEGREVHLHDTIENAKSYLEEILHGRGEILGVMVDGLNVYMGVEYTHPVVLDRVAAYRVYRLAAGY